MVVIGVRKNDVLTPKAQRETVVFSSASRVRLAIHSEESPVTEIERRFR